MTTKRPRGSAMKKAADLSTAELLALLQKRVESESSIVADISRPRPQKVSDPRVKMSPKLCPHCKESKPATAFGLRNVRGVLSLQSWCDHCRASTNYYKLPRKNRTKHNP